MRCPEEKLPITLGTHHLLRKESQNTGNMGEGTPWTDDQERYLFYTEKGQGDNWLPFRYQTSGNLNGGQET